MSDAPRDFFHTARAWAATGLVVAAALMVLGAALDWVSVETLPETIPSDQARFAEPFNGFDVRDGYVVTGAAVVVVFSAVMVMVKARSSYGWLAFISSIVAGGIAISDYRDIAGLFEDFGGIGRGISPGPGLVLVAFGGLLGVMAAVTSVAASPRRD